VLDLLLQHILETKNSITFSYCDSFIHLIELLLFFSNSINYNTLKIVTIIYCLTYAASCMKFLRSHHNSGIGILASEFITRKIRKILN